MRTAERFIWLRRRTGSGMPSVGLVVATLLVLIGGPVVRHVWACESTTLRDAAFNEPRDVHRLCVVGKAGDSSTRNLRDQLASWLRTAGPSLNLELTAVPVEEPNVPWTEYGIPSAPPAWPVVVLAGRRTYDRKSFFIDHWEPGPTAAELELLRRSPAREVIRQEVGRRLALLLYVPGTDAGAGRAAKVLEATIAAWAKKEPAGLEMARVDRSDPNERLLLSFIGVRPSGPDWVAVVFGRGKLMPPLQGPEITETRLDELIQPLVGECTCMRSPRSMGVDLLMLWDEALDKAVVKLRTDDVSPGQGPGRSAVAVALSAAPGRPVLGSALWTFGAIALFVVAAMAIVLLRRLQRVP
jgi:hypothetical protein